MNFSSHLGGYMKTQLFYFTGTGNSLHVANQIGKHLENATIHSIPQLVRENACTFDAERIGFIFPQYYGGMPEMVESFIKAIKTPSAKYTFAIITQGGEGNGFVQVQTKKLLASKGLSLNYVDSLFMGDNYIRMYGAKSSDVYVERHQKADAKVNHLLKDINQLKNKEASTGLIMGTIAKPVYSIWKNRLPKMDKKFNTDSACNNCGVCAQVCPANNIEMKQDKPSWNHKCQDCMACIQLCPQKSIALSEKTRARIRYKHEAVALKDIIEANQ